MILNTASTELTCDRTFSYARRKNVREKERSMLMSCGVVDFTSRPRQHGMRMSLFKSLKSSACKFSDQKLNHIFAVVTSKVSTEI